jgi:hypothetical protein
VLDFDTDGVVATPAHLAAGGATTPAPTMAEAHENLAAVGLASTPEDPAIFQPTIA